MHRYLSKPFIVPTFFILYAGFGSVLIYGHALFEVVFCLVLGLYSSWHVWFFVKGGKKHYTLHPILFILLISWALLASLQGAFYDLRALIFVCLFYSAVIFSIYVRIFGFRLSDAQLASASILFILSNSLIFYIGHRDFVLVQEYFKGSSALAFNLFFVSFLLLHYSLDRAIIIKIVSWFGVGSASFALGALDSRAWMILSFFLVFIFFLLLIEEKKFFVNAMTQTSLLVVLLFGSFAWGNFTIPVIARDNEVDVQYFLSKLTNVTDQVIEVVISFNQGLADSERTEGIASRSVASSADLLSGDEEQEEFRLRDWSCSLADMNFISRSLPNYVHDWERIVEPLVGSLEWYRQDNILRKFFGAGVHSSKYGLLDCFSRLYDTIGHEPIHNIGVYRGNTISTFLYEFGLLGILVSIFILIFSAARMRAVYFFSALTMLSAVALTNVSFNSTILLAFGSITSYLVFEGRRYR